MFFGSAVFRGSVVEFQNGEKRKEKKYANKQISRLDLLFSEEVWLNCRMEKTEQTKNKNKQISRLALLFSEKMLNFRMGRKTKNQYNFQKDVAFGCLEIMSVSYS